MTLLTSTEYHEINIHNGHLLSFMNLINTIKQWTLMTSKFCDPYLHWSHSHSLLRVDAPHVCPRSATQTPSSLQTPRTRRSALRTRAPTSPYCSQSSPWVPRRWTAGDYAGSLRTYSAVSACCIRLGWSDSLHIHKESTTFMKYVHNAQLKYGNWKFV